MDGCRAVLWGEKSVSVFDMFDAVQPTTFFTHCNLITNDLIKYLSNSQIECVFNVTYAQQEHVDRLDEVILGNKIKCPFMFTNQPREFNSLVQRKTKLISVMHGADIFLSKQSVDIPDYSLEMGVITDYKPEGGRLSSLSNKHSTYHIISTDPELSNHVDIISPTTHMYALYPKYQKTVITQSERYFPQCLFDSMLYGNETYYLTRSKGQQEKSDATFRSLFRDCDSSVCGEDAIHKGGINFTKLRSTLLEKHTCVGRVKSIMSRLKCSTQSSTLDGMIQEHLRD